MPKSPYKAKSSLSNQLRSLLVLFLFFSYAILFLVGLTAKPPVSTGDPTRIVPEVKPRPVRSRVLDISSDELEEVTVVNEIPLTGEALYNSYVHEICETYYPNVDPYLIRSMIEQESSYRAEIIGDNGKSYGLMQIQPRWNQDRMSRLGVSDLLDPYSNILVGVDLVSELLETTPTVEYALMSYNGGPTYAHKLYSQGRVSTYATEVIARFYTLKGGA